MKLSATFFPFTATVALLLPVLALGRGEGQPIVEVTIESSLKGAWNYQLNDRELRTLAMASLENSGIRKGVVFFSRDKQAEKRDVTDRDRGGYYEELPGGERGQFIRPTHRLRLSVVVERSFRQIEGAGLISDVLRITGVKENLTADVYRRTEHIVVRLKGNLFDAQKSISVGAVKPVRAEAQREQLLKGSATLEHREWLKIWILEIPITVDDYVARFSQGRTSSELELSSMAVNAANEYFAVELAKVLQPGLAVSKAPDEIRAESLDQDRQTLTLSGSIVSLKVGQILVIPILPARGEPIVGEEAHVYAKVTKVGLEMAVAVLVAGADAAKRTTLGREYVLDRRRPVRRL